MSTSSPDVPEPTPPPPTPEQTSEKTAQARRRRYLLDRQGSSRRSTLLSGGTNQYQSGLKRTLGG